ncbi:DUF2267 domain-containing protein [Micromonospora zhanjiangensis]|uniref:DUF2267 domain-containing protein n=1 Tax=Micromonospora zhanjiangensis TaxID=1522057 RepID=A0ABV8KT25_9ACTN
MDYDTMIDLVARRTDLPSEQAVDLTRVTLEALNERITAGEALDLAAQLPKPLQGLLRPPDETAEAFTADELIRRVGREAGLPGPAAETGVRAVFATLREALPGGGFDELTADLPADFRDLAQPAPVTRQG